VAVHHVFHSNIVFGGAIDSKLGKAYQWSIRVLGIGFICSIGKVQIMVSETAKKTLGLETDAPSREDVAKAFWHLTEQIDRQIIAAEDETELARLLDEKDRLFEARSLLEGISIPEIQKQIVKGGTASPPARGLLLLIAIAGWLTAAALFGFALMNW
jgi:hypothetical protein